ncbi:ATP synthase [Epithele typhae]|uniref:ATP synthase n=1 Tax=Epithele typhae TaxID=378194 RepID=UPI002008A006|nr:ATP synthase [Epithele typhae]KAH9913074.1 ATP synthase [Epithele typhae]
MASRIAASSLRASASRVRPQAVSAIPRVVAARGMASSSKPPPEERAAEIINTLPSSPGLVTKTGTAILGTGLLATAISQELYVVNEETVIAAGFFILITFIYRSAKDGYREWAEDHINRFRNILNSSRSEHTQVVKDRIQSVEQMKDVVSITEGLFALSKETAKLENEAFVQRQKVTLATEVKSVLDSWVRFEQQAKESEQADLVKSVVDNVMKSIQDPKVQKEVLTSAVAEIEQLIKNKAI